MKFKTYSQLHLLMLVIFTLNSCSHSYYAPNAGDNLKLSEAKDLKISASGATNGELDVYGNNLKHRNFKIGYSPINHLGIIGSHFQIESIESNTKYGNGQLTYFGIGSYYFLKKRNTTNKITKSKYGVKPGVLFDIYGGYGKGNVLNVYSEGGSSDLSFRKYFLQGGIHWNGKILGNQCNIQIRITGLSQRESFGTH